MVRRSPSDAVGRADRIAIRAILVVGLLGGASMTGLGLFTAATRVLDPGRYPIELLSHLPVPTGASVTDAYTDSILVHTSALSGSARWLLAAGDLFSALTLGTVTLCFSLVLWRVAQRQPFHRSMQLAALITGCAIVLGSLLSQALGGFGTMMAARELSGSLDGAADPAFPFTPLPVIVGFGILALAYVFRAGARLQRDTEGLV